MVEDEDGRAQAERSLEERVTSMEISMTHLHRKFSNMEVKIDKNHTKITGQIQNLMNLKETQTQS